MCSDEDPGIAHKQSRKGEQGTSAWRAIEQERCCDGEAGSCMVRWKRRIGARRDEYE